MKQDTLPAARVAILGPVFPYKGGIALHTTELAHRLEASGYEVKVISWKHQYPSFLYKGEQRLKDEKPEIEPFHATTYALNWYNPFGWWRTGRELKRFDFVIVIFFVPQIQGPFGTVISWALGHGKHRPQLIALCHNVLPHETRPGDKLFSSYFLRRVDRVLVHSKEQAGIARALTPKDINVAAMAPHLPQTARDTQTNHTTLKHHLLFFGIVRRYKGVDILLRALADTPDITLTIAGEVWGTLKQELPILVHDLGIEERVSFIDGYIPSEHLPKLFAESDALVLPYRSSTGTQNVDMGFAYGLPVIATRVGTNTQRIKNHIDGLLCKPEDVADLARTINHFYDAKVAQTLQKNVHKPTADTSWQTYIQTLLSK